MEPIIDREHIRDLSRAAESENWLMRQPLTGKVAA